MNPSFLALVNPKGLHSSSERFLIEGKGREETRTFLDPDIFGRSFYAFRNRYFQLEKNGQTIPNGAVVSREALRNYMMRGFKYTCSEFFRDHIMYLIRNITDWVKKEDALDLPDQITEIRDVELSSAEKNSYIGMKKNLIVEISGQDVAVQVALAKLMKLRQITSGFIYNEQHEALQIGKSKLNALLETLEDLGNRQIIVFCQFHHEIK